MERGPSLSEEAMLELDLQRELEAVAYASWDTSETGNSFVSRLSDDGDSEGDSERGYSGSHVACDFALSRPFDSKDSLYHGNGVADDGTQKEGAYDDLHESLLRRLSQNREGTASEAVGIALQLRESLEAERLEEGLLEDRKLEPQRTAAVGLEHKVVCSHREGNASSTVDGFVEAEPPESHLRESAFADNHGIPREYPQAHMDREASTETVQLHTKMSCEPTVAENIEGLWDFVMLGRDPQEPLELMLMQQKHRKMLLKGRQREEKRRSQLYAELSLCPPTAGHDGIVTVLAISKASPTTVSDEQSAVHVAAGRAADAHIWANPSAAVVHVRLRPDEECVQETRGAPLSLPHAATGAVTGRELYNEYQPHGRPGVTHGERNMEEAPRTATAIAIGFRAERREMETEDRRSRAVSMQLHQLTYEQPHMAWEDSSRQRLARGALQQLQQHAANLKALSSGAVTAIAAAWRGYAARKAFRVQRALRVFLLPQNKVYRCRLEKLQAIWRGGITRQQLRKRGLRLPCDKEKHLYATKIQAAFRGHRTRRLLRSGRLAARELQLEIDLVLEEVESRHRELPLVTLPEISSLPPHMLWTSSYGVSPLFRSLRLPEAFTRTIRKSLGYGLFQHTDVWQQPQQQKDLQPPRLEQPHAQQEEPPSSLAKSAQDQTPECLLPTTPWTGAASFESLRRVGTSTQQQTLHCPARGLLGSPKQVEASKEQLDTQESPLPHTSVTAQGCQLSRAVHTLSTQSQNQQQHHQEQQSLLHPRENPKLLKRSESPGQLQGAFEQFATKPTTLRNNPSESVDSAYSQEHQERQEGQRGSSEVRTAHDHSRQQLQVLPGLLLQQKELHALAHQQDTQQHRQSRQRTGSVNTKALGDLKAFPSSEHTYTSQPSCWGQKDTKRRRQLVQGEKWGRQWRPQQQTIVQGPPLPYDELPFSKRALSMHTVQRQQHVSQGPSLLQSLQPETQHPYCASLRQKQRAEASTSASGIGGQGSQVAAKEQRVANAMIGGVQHDCLLGPMIRHPQHALGHQPAAHKAQQQWPHARCQEKETQHDMQSEAGSSSPSPCEAASNRLLPAPRERAAELYYKALSLNRKARTTRRRATGTPLLTLRALHFQGDVPGSLSECSNSPLSVQASLRGKGDDPLVTQSAQTRSSTSNNIESLSGLLEASSLVLTAGPLRQRECVSAASVAFPGGLQREASAATGQPQESSGPRPRQSFSNAFIEAFGVEKAMGFTWSSSLSQSAATGLQQQRQRQRPLLSEPFTLQASIQSIRGPWGKGS
ncbi:hypothetical protein cyc_05389 [Cyclospora cayetanensis]|uniref:IQ calmodulin-binding motif domain-containing protein n=1 Tax=Cyclospora cayetanensis TaxID=88456 RepID=A0A1D3D678_9EIME|nr:hypothetical protein cyc_05389 [Cyclospora cayetanensis]